MADEVRLRVAQEADIIRARREGREIAQSLGFGSGDLALIATAISEIARNVVIYARQGEMCLRVVQGATGRRGIEVVTADEGPGIADIDLAMRDGFSSGTGLGLGLPGARRLMDDFEITSAVGVGTRVTMRKWAR